MAQSSQGLTPTGRAARLAGRVRSAARRPILWGTSYAGDAVLAAAITIAGVVTAIEGNLYVTRSPVLARPTVTYVIGPPVPHPHLPAALSWALAGVLMTTAPLAFRRTYPTSAFCVILAASIAISRYTTAITVGAAIVAAYSAVAYSRYRRTTRLVLLAGAMIVTVSYSQATAQVPERYTPLLVLVPAVALGYMMRMWRLRAGESAERLRLVQAAHEAQTRRAVETERARIAAELHDVVTHNVSVMVVQAGAARRVLDMSPGDARAALVAIEASGRNAMTELRHLLGLLAPPGGTGSAEADDGVLRPQPGLAEVPALVARVRAAGMPVQLAMPGGSIGLPQSLDLAAYRVVQEALTNVMKHAEQARTAVRIERRADYLLIDVANDAPAGSRSSPGDEGGRGLIGLRERIAIYGGSLDAGPRPGGGWQVSAKIPLEPVAAGLDEARAECPARSS